MSFYIRTDGELIHTYIIGLDYRLSKMFIRENSKHWRLSDKLTKLLREGT